MYVCMYVCMYVFMCVSDLLTVPFLFICSFAPAAERVIANLYTERGPVTVWSLARGSLGADTPATRCSVLGAGCQQVCYQAGIARESGRNCATMIGTTAVPRRDFG